MNNASKRLIRGREVEKKTGYGTTTLRSKVKRGEFPEPVRLGEGPTSPRVWDEAEVDRWIEDRLRAGRERRAA